MATYYGPKEFAVNQFEVDVRNRMELANWLSYARWGINQTTINASAIDSVQAIVKDNGVAHTIQGQHQCARLADGSFFDLAQLKAYKQGPTDYAYDWAWAEDELFMTRQPEEFPDLPVAGFGQLPQALLFWEGITCSSYTFGGFRKNTIIANAASFDILSSKFLNSRTIAVLQLSGSTLSTVQSAKGVLYTRY